MAIDSASKRASALGFGFIALTLVVPDGTIDQGDRQTVAHQYSGILATEAVVAVGKPYSLTSIIETHGIGVLSTITASGQSVSSGIEQGIGLTSIMQSRGLGVAGTITDSKGVSSDI